MTLRKLLLCAAALCATVAFAQRPGVRTPAEPPKDAPKPDDLTARLMAFDKDKDGKLKKDEITDERLARLFDRLDADKDGSVTADELKAFAAKEEQLGGGRPGFGGGFPGGPGGGPGGFAPPKPGTVLPGFIADELKLTDDQKKKLDELQKDVDSKLEKLLTDDQKKILKEFAERGPGGFGGPGGPGGPGGGGRGPGGPGGGRPGGPGGGGGGRPGGGGR